MPGARFPEVSTVDAMAATLRSARQPRAIHGRISTAGTHAVLRSRGDEEAGLGCRLEWTARRCRSRLTGLRHACDAGRHGCSTWLDLRIDAYRVDRRRVDISLQRRLDHRTVPGDEGLDCRTVVGQAAAARAD